MMEQILQLIELFEAQIYDFSAMSKDNSDNLFLDFENDVAWSSFSYNKKTRELTSAMIESKDRKYYYQLVCKNSDYDLDGEAIGLDVYEDYLEKAAAIWKSQPFDERIIMEFEIDTDVKEIILKACDDLGITIDEYMTDILRELIKAHDEELGHKS